MKFNVITFGCQMNVHDSDWLIRAMESRGWKAVEESEAEVFVVNTCSVREKPEQKVYSVLGRLGGYCTRPGSFVAVGGCVAQQIGNGFFEKFPFVRLVFGSDGIAKAPQALEELAEDHNKKLIFNDFLTDYPEREKVDSSPYQDLVPPGIGTITGQAFVNIMQGCDNFCTYCIVPYTRGRQKSRDPEHVIEECRNLVESGVREITLLGQNVNSFGMDSGGTGVSFADLLYKISAIAGLERIRFTTSHPKDIAPEVITAFGELPNLCPQLHLPMQSGSDSVLKRMGRKYDRKRYLEIVDGLKAACPEISLSTDIIVGFPGETDEDFENTMEMLEKVRFESSFSFKYSDRPGVAAVKFKPKVSDDIAQKRLTRLQERQNHITRESLERCVGRETEILLERPSRKQGDGDIHWRGKDPWGRVVNVPLSGITDDDSLGGKLLKVLITEAKNHSLFGKKVGNPW